MSEKVRGPYHQSNDIFELINIFRSKIECKKEFLSSTREAFAFCETNNEIIISINKYQFLEILDEFDFTISQSLQAIHTLETELKNIRESIHEKMKDNTEHLIKNEKSLQVQVKDPFDGDELANYRFFSPTNNKNTLCSINQCEDEKLGIPLPIYHRPIATVSKKNCDKEKEKSSSMENVKDTMSNEKTYLISGMRLNYDYSKEYKQLLHIEIENEVLPKNPKEFFNNQEKKTTLSEPVKDNFKLKSIETNQTISKNDYHFNLTESDIEEPPIQVISHYKQGLRQLIKNKSNSASNTNAHNSPKHSQIFNEFSENLEKKEVLTSPPLESEANDCHIISKREAFSKKVNQLEKEIIFTNLVKRIHNVDGCKIYFANKYGDGNFEHFLSKLTHFELSPEVIENEIKMVSDMLHCQKNRTSPNTSAYSKKSLSCERETSHKRQEQTAGMKKETSSKYIEPVNFAQFLRSDSSKKCMVRSSSNIQISIPHSKKKRQPRYLEGAKKK